MSTPDDDGASVVSGVWSCCGGTWPDHKPRCRRLMIRSGDFHDWDDGDPYPHERSGSCGCQPERVEVAASLANPNWEGCLWRHREGGGVTAR